MKTKNLTDKEKLEIVSEWFETYQSILNSMPSSIGDYINRDYRKEWKLAQAIAENPFADSYDLSYYGIEEDEEE